MRIIILVLLVGVVSHAKVFAAVCEGFYIQKSTGGPAPENFICESSPESAATKYCQHYFDNWNDSSLTAISWYMDDFMAVSTQFSTYYLVRCALVVQTESGVQFSYGPFRSHGIYPHFCPGNAIAVEFSAGFGLSCAIECDQVPEWMNGERRCFVPEENTCKSGQGRRPINFLTGNKLFTEVDYQSGGVNNLHFTRYYNSHNNRIRRSAGGWIDPDKEEQFFNSNNYRTSSNTSSISDFAASGNPFKRVSYETFVMHEGTANETSLVIPKLESLPSQTNRLTSYWRNNFDLTLLRINTDLSYLRLIRENGDEYSFSRTDTTNTVYVPDRPDNRGVERVVVFSNGFTYVKDNRDKEYYNTEGVLIALEAANGYTQTLSYDERGRLVQVSDSLGRSLTFTHDAQDRIHSMTTPDGDTFHYSYEGDTNFSRVYYPDGEDDGSHLNNPYRRYVYEDARFSNAVTGIYENTERYGTYVYGEDGRAIYSGLANGAEGYSVNFNGAHTTVTNALGKKTVYHYDNSNKLTQIVGEPSDNCLGDSRTFTYDANKFKASETDKNGNITTFTRDELGREISRTEAFGTPQARTVTSEWHPSLNVQTKVTEPERITNYSYDAKGLLLNQTVTPNPAQ